MNPVESVDLEEIGHTLEEQERTVAGWLVQSLQDKKPFARADTNIPVLGRPPRLGIGAKLEVNYTKGPAPSFVTQHDSVMANYKLKQQLRGRKKTATPALPRKENVDDDESRVKSFGKTKPILPEISKSKKRKR